MIAVLDYIFLNTWILFLGLLITLPAGIVLGKRQWLKNTIKDRLLSVVFFSLPALFIVPGILNPLYLGYGYATEFSKASLSENYLCLLDYLSLGSDEDNSIVCVRLQLLDPETGLRKKRIVLGNNVQLLDHQKN